MEDKDGAASLKKQLEMARFERALEVSDSMADHKVLLTTTELARLNNIITGKSGDPWRQEQETVTIKTPSGSTKTLTLMADPVIAAREHLHKATELAESSAQSSVVIDAAVGVYVGLVKAHSFEDGNRRTAVLASNYFLRRYGVPISGMALHELGLGDINDEAHLQALRDTIRQMAMFAAKRNAAKGTKPS
ncbi:MAG: Fic family protein [Bdellovibrionota bacterium]